MNHLFGAIVPIALLVSCTPQPVGTDPIPASSRDWEALVDVEFLTDRLWSDGQAEVAFYRVDRTRNQYGDEEDQSFLAGTYVVKQPFDRARMSKAEPGASSVSAFKVALFYEFDSQSYQYKRAWVVNAAQHTMEPLKASFTMFDWCANTYEELAFGERGMVSLLRRTDDYGNDAKSFTVQAGTYPAAQLPMLVRALDFSDDGSSSFFVLNREGEAVAVTAHRMGVEVVETEAGSFDADRIEVRYDGAVPSLLGETADPVETYWRARTDARLLLRVEAASGRYRMDLVEHLRSPYWSENLWPRLERVGIRP